MFALVCLVFCVVIWFADFFNHQKENMKQAQQGADKCRPLKNRHCLTDEAQIAFPIMHLGVSSMFTFFEIFHTIFIMT